jgi:hypothetical protein
MNRKAGSLKIPRSGSLSALGMELVSSAYFRVYYHLHKIFGFSETTTQDFKKLENPTSLEAENVSVVPSLQAHLLVYFLGKFFVAVMAFKQEEGDMESNLTSLSTNPLTHSMSSNAITTLINTPPTSPSSSATAPTMTIPTPMNMSSSSNNLTMGSSTNIMSRNNSTASLTAMSPNIPSPDPLPPQLLSTLFNPISQQLYEWETQQSAISHSLWLDGPSSGALANSPIPYYTSMVASTASSVILNELGSNPAAAIQVNYPFAHVFLY